MACEGRPPRGEGFATVVLPGNRLRVLGHVTSLWRCVSCGGREWRPNEGRIQPSVHSTGIEANRGPACVAPVTPAARVCHPFATQNSLRIAVLRRERCRVAASPAFGSIAVFEPAESSSYECSSRYKECVMLSGASRCSTERRVLPPPSSPLHPPPAP